MRAARFQGEHPLIDGGQGAAYGLLRQHRNAALRRSYCDPVY
jgi:hypothetical protein